MKPSPKVFLIALFAFQLTTFVLQLIYNDASLWTYLLRSGALFFLYPIIYLYYKEEKSSKSN